MTLTNRAPLRASRIAIWGMLLALAAAAPVSATGLFSHGSAKPPAAPTPTDADAAAIASQATQAINERRYVDAGSLLDGAQGAGLKSPELTMLRGELYLARGRFSEALAVFRSMAADPAHRAQALEGSGVALSMQGQSEAAMADLKMATGLDKNLWRAWNALGREYDLREEWSKSKIAYATALAIPGANTAIILNNQGYSLLLQKQMDGAAADFVAALEKDPSLAAARTNLRITLAVEGNYERASVMGVGDDKASVLNNVGLAAAMRGDYLEADKLLNQAVAAKGQYYGRAAENLQLTHTLAERADEATVASDGPH
jgi:Flp pilus assembly protein TadD